MTTGLLVTGHDDAMVGDDRQEPTFCCRALEEFEAQTCDQHPSPWDCCDAVIVRHPDGTYGLPVRDQEDSSAISSVAIRYCPWCGSPLPGHESRPPTDADRAAGLRAARPVGERPIVRAAEVGDLGQVQALLSAGVPALDPDPGGWTALHAAAVGSHTEVVRALLEAGPDVDVRDEDSFTPLLNAAGVGNRATIALLIEAGADVNITGPSWAPTPLSRAAEYANLEVLDLLLEAGADPNAGEPLVDAAEAGSLDGVTRLLAAGPDVNVRVDGKTAAELARRHGHEEVARLLESTQREEPGS